MKKKQKQQKHESESLIKTKKGEPRIEQITEDMDADGIPSTRVRQIKFKPKVFSIPSQKFKENYDKIDWSN